MTASFKLVETPPLPRPFDLSVVEAANLPNPSAAVRDSLKRLIEAHGPTEPILVCAKTNAVIDGAVRLSIYEELGLTDVPILAVDCDSFEEAVALRRLRHLARRNLNAWQRCRIVYEGWLSQKIGRKAKNGEGCKYTIAGYMADTNKETMRQVVQIMRRLSGFDDNAEAKIRALEEGKRSIHAVYSDLRSARNEIVGDGTFRKGKGRKKKAKVNGGPVLMTKPSSLIPDDFNDKIVLGDNLDVLRKVPDGGATLIVTSIPYIGANYLYDGTFNDSAEYDTYLTFLKVRFAECYRVLREGGIAAINLDCMTARGEEKVEMHFRIPLHIDAANLMRQVGFRYFDEICWLKNHAPGRRQATGTIGSQRIRRNHETILLFSKGVHKIGNVEQSRIDLDRSLPLTKDWSLSTWAIPPERGFKEHPCPFSYRIPYRLIKLFSYKNDLVVDPFVGIGTTCRAAKDLGRRYLGIDVVDKYVALAQQRLAMDGTEELDKARKAEQAIMDKLDPEPVLPSGAEVELFMKTAA